MGMAQWREPEDWVKAIEELFSLVVSESDVLAARDRAVGAERLVYSTLLASIR